MTVEKFFDVKDDHKLIILGAPQRAERHWQGAGARWAPEGFDTTKTSKVYVTFIQ